MKVGDYFVNETIPTRLSVVFKIKKIEGEVVTCSLISRNGTLPNTITRKLSSLNSAKYRKISKLEVFIKQQGRK